MPITQTIVGTNANEFFHVPGDGFVAPVGYVDRPVATAVGEIILSAGGNDIVHGGGDLDVLWGQGGNDKLYGEAGGDQFLGGTGSDELYGGAGDDIYSIGDEDEYVPGDIDLIVEGVGQGIDMVYVYVPDYTLTANVEDGSTTFLHGTLKGNVLDNDLFAGGGTPSNNHLFGFAGTDTLNGGYGDDVLDGGTGGDTLYGSPGFDTAIYSASVAGVWVSLLAGSGLRGDAQGDKLFGIEAVVGSASTDTLIGDGTANRLDGGAGNDILEGGAGADALIGGAGIDTAYYSGSSTGVIAQLTPGTGSGGDAAGDTLTGVEQLCGSNLNDMLAGDSNANGLWGAGGADTLTGGAGADQLKGGAGNDRFVYAAVIDSTVAAAGRDVINDFSSGDRIDLSGIDADGQASNGNTEFRFATAFTGHAGELLVIAQKNGYQVVYLDVDGDRAADSAIVVLSDHKLTAADFVL